MPKNRQKGSAHNAREGVHARKKKRASGGQGRGGQAATAPILADSLAAVRFQRKPGSKVFFEIHNGEEIDKENYPSMYNDLLACTRRLHEQVEGSPLDFDPVAVGLGLPTSIDWMIKKIKGLLPEGVMFNIEKGYTEDNLPNYYLMVYADAPHNGVWNSFGIRQTLAALKKKRPVLWAIYLEFIRAFEFSTGIEMWYQGCLDWTLERFEEEVEIAMDDDDFARADSYRNEIAKYKCGEPEKYRLLLRSMEPSPACEIERQLKRLRKPHPIIDLIKAGVPLLDKGIGIGNFFYLANNVDDIYLSFDQQFGIMWDLDDDLTADHEEYINNLGNEGLQEPVISLKILPDTTEIDFTKFKREAEWLLNLYKFFDTAWDAIKKTTNE